MFSGCTCICWVEETDGPIYKLFHCGHFEIQEGHHIGSNLVNISPAGGDSKMVFFSSKCVFSVYAPYYVQAKIKSISSDTHQLHVIPLHYFTIKILIFDPLCRSEMLNKNKCQRCLSRLVFITGQLFRQASTVGTVKIALSETAFYCCIHM